MYYTSSRARFADMQPASYSRARSLRKIVIKRIRKPGPGIVIAMYSKQYPRSLCSLSPKTRVNNSGPDLRWPRSFIMSSSCRTKRHTHVVTLHICGICCALFCMSRRSIVQNCIYPINWLVFCGAAGKNAALSCASQRDVER